MAKKKKASKTAPKKEATTFEISPCPFASCKGKAKLSINPWGKYVVCNGCGASGPESPTSTPDRIPINAWNNR